MEELGGWLGTSIQALVTKSKKQAEKLVFFWYYSDIVKHNRKLNMPLKNYFEQETPCRCGCGFDVDKKITWILNFIRAKIGKPVVCTSGARCKKHNENIGGALNSAHTKGLAADIKFRNSNEKFIIIQSLLAVGVNRIGINDKKSFIHFDIDDSKPNNVIFKY